MTSSLPTTMKALVCPQLGSSLSVTTVPVPDPDAGSVLIKVECLLAQPSLLGTLAGKSGFKFPEPMTPGNHAIGRISRTGPDTTGFEVGQLVIVDGFIRARDNPDVQFLWGFWGGPTPTSQKFMADNWRSGTCSEYVKAPLENVYALDEKRLCGSETEGGLGYALEDLLPIYSAQVPFGGFRGIDVKPGESIIISPGTGHFGGAAVSLAVGLGARVIVAGRRAESLQALQERFKNIHTVQITGDIDEDTKALQAKYGPVDAYFDISPAAAAGSTHITSCISALRSYGRVSLMGVVPDVIPVPYVALMGKNITIRGQFMYEREDVRGLIKMAESGIWKLGRKGGWSIEGRFKLEDGTAAYEAGERYSAAGQYVVINV